MYIAPIAHNGQQLPSINTMKLSSPGIGPLMPGQRYTVVVETAFPQVKKIIYHQIKEQYVNVSKVWDKFGYTPIEYASYMIGDLPGWDIDV